MKNFYDLTFREEQEQKEFILKTLCQNPYISVIQKLNKTQLIILIHYLLDKLYNSADLNLQKRTLGDVLIKLRHLMIESLDPDFFKKEGEDE